MLVKSVPSNLASIRSANSKDQQWVAELLQTEVGKYQNEDYCAKVEDMFDRYVRGGRHFDHSSPSGHYLFVIESPRAKLGFTHLTEVRGRAMEIKQLIIDAGSREASFLHTTLTGHSAALAGRLGAIHIFKRIPSSHEEMMRAFSKYGSISYVSPSGSTPKKETVFYKQLSIYDQFHPPQ